MTSTNLRSGPCYSVLLVRPFLKMLREHPQFPNELLEPLEAQQPEDRVPVVAMLELLRGAVLITQDENLGLKAALAADRGNYDVIEYAALSCHTVRGAVEALVRYWPLVNEALEITLTEEDGVLTTRLTSRVPLNRQAADFQLAALIVAARRWGATLVPPDIRIFFQHPAPANLEVYREAFGDAPITFDAAFDGYAHSSAILETTLPGADPNLHNIVTRQADELLSQLPGAHTFADTVRDSIVLALPKGLATAELISKELFMSRRTLTRRLELEATNFKLLREEMRQQLATRYLKQTQISIAEIAFLTGFSEAAPFNRAFRRWTGTTPTEYRQDHA